ncbi:MAG: DUF192 domain-containing protein [Sutterellaceae bacterium]|nr:DUF192 domain-containing protein [Sutterellaceae bacterium]
MRRFTLLLPMLALIAAHQACAVGVQTVEISGITVTLEIAQTPEEQRQGLMYRTALPKNHGMLFIFEPPRQVAMWMKNTRMDIDAAFFDACGKLLNIQTMKEGTLDLHHSFGNAATVVEMAGGWFAQNDIRSGITVPALVQTKYCRK